MPRPVVLPASKTLNASSESVSFLHFIIFVPVAESSATLVAVNVTSPLASTVTLPDASTVAALLSDELHVTSCAVSAGETEAASVPELTMASSPDTVTTGTSDAALVYVHESETDEVG